MGTRNYCNENAKYTYSIEPNTSEENIKSYRENMLDYYSIEEIEDTFNNEMICERIAEDFYEFWVERIRDDIIYNMKEEVEKSGVDFITKDEWNNDRNFEWYIFWELSYIDLRTQQTFYIELIQRNWYYEWVNFDFSFYFTDENWYEIEREFLKKQIENKFDKMIEVIEEIYNNNTSPKKLIATFSNGEWVYESVK